jgi:hypothetical protein
MTAVIASGAVLAPLLLFSLSSWFPYTVWPRYRQAVAIVCLVVSVAAGLPFLFALPLRKRMKLILAAFYIPAILVILALYGMYFVCLAFEDCL